MNKSLFQFSCEDEQYIRTKITLLSFICSIFVIYIHATNYATIGATAASSGLYKAVYLIEDYIRKLLDIAVPMFFLISGVLFFRNFKINMLFDKWKKRLSTVVIPYLIWCFLYFAFRFVCTNVFAGALVSEEKMTLSFGSLLACFWTEEYYVLWFLKNLIIFIALAPIIYVLLKNHSEKIPTGLILLLALIIGKQFLPLETEILSGIEFYLVGSYIGLNSFDLLYKKNKCISVISILYIAFCFFSGFRFWGVGFKIVFILAAWYALDFLPMKGLSLPWWMSITFFTYVAHDMILEAMEKVVFVVLGKTPIIALLDYFLAPVLVEIILILCAYVLKRWLPIIWRILTGGRTPQKQ